MEDGECEGCGLAGARLGLADHIHARQHQRDHSRLDGRRLEVAEFGNGLHQFGAQIEGVKFGCHQNPFH